MSITQNSRFRRVIVYRSACADTAMSSSPARTRRSRMPSASTVRAPSTVSVRVVLIREYVEPSVM
jgi:hypothetical protein